MLQSISDKKTNVCAQIAPEVKAEAEHILSHFGIPASNAINMFYKQIILQRGMPFEVKLPPKLPKDISKLSEAELNAELQKGIDDINAGRSYSLDEVFVKFRKDYNKHLADRVQE